MSQVPDEIFENPRLAAIYDAFDGQRDDLVHYLAVARELNAKAILDVGCGTGTFACLLSKNGFTVAGIDPAGASLAIARGKPGADQVQWLLGDATSLPSMSVDLAFMTGNVAQVFLTDRAWEDNLMAIRQSLRPKGRLVFEVRDPARKAWTEWNRESTYKRISIANLGSVECWCEVTAVAQELVSFRWTYVFGSSGEIITSNSTLRFRDRKAIEYSLEKHGYIVEEVRDAPDRPGKEFVFLASRAQ